jgi:hypothetical protein
MSPARRFLLALLCATLSLGTPLVYATAGGESGASMQAMHAGDGDSGCDCCENESPGACAQHCAAAFGSALLETAWAGRHAPAADAVFIGRMAGFTSRIGPPGLRPPQ